MTFARWVFLLAGIYGVIAILPMYFLEEQVGRDSPPPVTHPELYYGFVGVVLAWQVGFLVIGSAPRRYRPMMIPAVLEKYTFVAAAAVLYTQDRVPALLLPFAGIDFVLGTLFVIAYCVTGPAQRA